MIHVFGSTLSSVQISSLNYGKIMTFIHSKSCTMVNIEKYLSVDMNMNARSLDLRVGMMSSSLMMSELHAG